MLDYYDWRRSIKNENPALVISPDTNGEYSNKIKNDLIDPYIVELWKYYIFESYEKHNIDVESPLIDKVYNFAKHRIYPHHISHIECSFDENDLLELCHDILDFYFDVI